jgi:hypothetical protein
MKASLKADLLKEGKTLRFAATQWISTETFDLCVKAEAKRLAKGQPVTLSIWVKAARSAIFPCDHCDGSGIYRWGASINGKPPQHSGPCHRCQEKGKMDASDCARTMEYHRHIAIA